MTSASLLIVLFVGTVVGAATGLALGDAVSANLLAILAGFLGAVLAAVARNLTMVRGAGVGPDNSRTPGLVIFYAAVASLAGSLGAKEVSDLSEVSSGVWIGTLAGLFSSLLLAILMITYHTNPGEPAKLVSRR